MCALSSDNFDLKKGVLLIFMCTVHLICMRHKNLSCRIRVAYGSDLVARDSVNYTK